MNLTLIYLTLCLTFMFAWPAQAAVTIHSVWAADYYQCPGGPCWPGAVSASSDQPFSGYPEICSMEYNRWFSSGFPRTQASNGEPPVCVANYRIGADGRYYVGILFDQPGPLDAPFAPLWCVSDPQWAAYCGTRGNETLRIQVVDGTGQIGEKADVPCVSISRGSFCQWP